MTDQLQLDVMQAAQTGRPPLRLDEDQQLVAALAWQAGAGYARARLMERLDEVNACWSLLDWRSHWQQVQDRVTEMEVAGPAAREWFRAHGPRLPRPRWADDPQSWWPEVSVPGQPAGRAES